MKRIEIDLTDIANLDNYIFWKMLENQEFNKFINELRSASDEASVNKILGKFFEWYEHTGDLENKNKGKKKKQKKLSKKKQRMQEKYIEYLDSRNKE
jgi:hypothetical protein